MWIFDHSSCHSTKADESFHVSKMNVNCGRKQRVMRDGFYDGKLQHMNYALGIPKGLRVVLGDMRKTMGSCYSDFKFEKTRVERFLVEKKKHIAFLLPKYHSELNPIERVSVQAKRYTKAYCKYSIHSLRKNINLALNSVPLQSKQKHFQKVRHYMFAYLDGIPGGRDLEKFVKKFKKNLKSHRKISE